MKIYNNPLAQKIFDILSPLVGDFMAKSSIKMNTGSIGCTEETLQAKDLQKFAESIRKALVVFLGSDSAQKVADKIAQLN